MGTTSPVQNGIIFIPHGITPSKIISATVLVEYSPDAYVSNSFSLPGYEFNFYINAGNIFILNSESNSTNILSKQVKVMITYEE
jgi:hypothetical protein